MTTMGVVGECFFWYRLTRVLPDGFHRAVKRLCVIELKQTAHPLLAGFVQLTFCLEITQCRAMYPSRRELCCNIACCLIHTFVGEALDNLQQATCFCCSTNTEVDWQHRLQPVKITLELTWHHYFLIYWLPREGMWHCLYQLSNAVTCALLLSPICSWNDCYIFAYFLRTPTSTSNLTASSESQWFIDSNDSPYGNITYLLRMSTIHFCVKRMPLKPMRRKSHETAPSWGTWTPCNTQMLWPTPLSTSYLSSIGSRTIALRNRVPIGYNGMPQIHPLKTARSLLTVTNPI